MWLVNLIDYYSEKNKKYIIITPCLYAIGTATEEILYGVIKARRTGKKLLIIRPRLPETLCRYVISNSEIYSIRCEYISNKKFLKYAIEIFITAIFTLTRITAIFLNKINVETKHHFNFPIIGIRDLWKKNMFDKFSWESVKKIEWEKLYQKQIFTITNEKYVLEEFYKMFLSGGSSEWYACLHVREPGYRKDYGRREYRNCDIMNYIPMIEEITKRNGYVVRLGDDSMKRLPHMPRVIDYPFTSMKSPLVDLVLIKNCKFYIGNQSGTWDVSNLFSKLTITTDMVHWLHVYPVKYGDIGIYKTIYDKQLRRNLNFLEIMNSGWGAMTLTKDFSARFKIIDNTPEQLKTLIIEFFEWIDKGVVYTNIQKKINNLRRIIGEKLVEQYKDESVSDVDALKFRYACRLVTSNGTMSNSYLENCHV